MENSIVASYISLLLGCVIQHNTVSEIVIRIIKQQR
jgi:hypothetical protein